MPSVNRLTNDVVAISYLTNDLNLVASLTNQKVDVGLNRLAYFSPHLVLAIAVLPKSFDKIQEIA